VAVQLVWVTPRAQEQIVYCARVSNPKSQSEGRDPERLIRYLIKHKHWSPFQMANMCVEVNTTRDIAAQILRHSSFAFQEFSQRYSDVSLLGGYGPFELRYQDVKNRQNSIYDEGGSLSVQFSDKIQDLLGASQALYDEMLDAGVAKECARKVLCLQAPSRMYINGTIRSWVHYLQVRMSLDTQEEHREIAQGVAALLREQCPDIVAACDLPA
jgi:thymidylate synthase (FAD)